jgi:hypothetical protein
LLICILKTTKDAERLNKNGTELAGKLVSSLWKEMKFFPYDIDEKFCTDEQKPREKLEESGTAEHWPEKDRKKLSREKAYLSH